MLRGESPMHPPIASIHHHSVFHSDFFFLHPWTCAGLGGYVGLGIDSQKSGLVNARERGARSHRGGSSGSQYSIGCSKTETRTYTDMDSDTDRVEGIECLSVH